VESRANKRSAWAGDALLHAVRRLNRALGGARAFRVGEGRVYAESVDQILAVLAWKANLLERRARALVEREVKPGMVAVDAGAGIGLFTLELARRVGPSGRVYAVEAEERNFRLLSRAVEESGLPQVELRRVAASDSAGWMTLYLSEVNRGDHRIFQAAEERQAVTLRAVRLDDLLADEGHVDFVRLDLQGAEASALRGLRRTLQRNARIGVLCRVRPALLQRAGVAASMLFEPLQEAGFVPHVIGRDGRAHPVGASAAWSSALSTRGFFVYFKRAGC